MNPEILKDLLPRLKNDFKFRESGDRFIQGTCPSCSKKELYTFKDRPWVLRCGRLNTCAAEISVKDEYPDLFDNWSNRFQKTEENPNAAADAYLISRGLDISALHGAYSQENFWDPIRKIGSATVRFQLRNESWWERLIDQPSRFEKKANFRPKGRDGSYGYGGHWWAHPKDTIEKLANAPEIWIAEGIFDAIALRMAGKAAVSSMSVSNYCDKSLKEIVKFHTENDIKTRPTLVFAYDIGKAGADYTKKHIERARAEGWNAIAAQPADEDKSKKSDWNDLLQAEKLEPENFQDYLYFGALLTAESAMEKALLLYTKTKANSFYFHFENRTFWCKFNQQTFNDARKEELSEKKSTELALSISEIMSAKTHCLYFQRNQAIDETHYYFEITLPNGKKSKDRFSGAQISAAGDFKKRLLSVAPGAQFTGNTAQLERIIGKQTANLKTVETLEFTGYSREYQAYVFGDFAVKNGRVFRLNAEDHFELGRDNLKLLSGEKLLKHIVFSDEKFEYEWLENIWIAWRENGLLTFIFWVMSIYAEQIRKQQESLGFLEMSGESNTGKSTLINFLWKLCGRANHEGIEPSKTTLAGISRELAKVANLPVVIMEGDTKGEGAHVKRFDFDTLKGLYNGEGMRVRAIKSGGNETYAPKFRGSIVIEQNLKVNAEEPTLSRLMSLDFTREGFNDETLARAEQLAQWDIEDVSGTIIYLSKNEKIWLERFLHVFPKWRQRFGDDADAFVRHYRIRKTHAQLHAAVDATFKGQTPLFKIPAERIAALHSFIDQIATRRDLTLNSDHEVVTRFWRKVEWLDQRSSDTDMSRLPLNHSAKPDHIFAINLTDFEQRCAVEKVHPDDKMEDIRKHLKSSKNYKFIECKNVYSRHSGKGSPHCWVFFQPSGKE